VVTSQRQRQLLQSLLLLPLLPEAPNGEQRLIVLIFSLVQGAAKTHLSRPRGQTRIKTKAKVQFGSGILVVLITVALITMAMRPSCPFACVHKSAA
jgi:hypothetical protein